MEKHPEDGMDVWSFCKSGQRIWSDSLGRHRMILMACTMDNVQAALVSVNLRYEGNIKLLEIWTRRHEI
jgi:hypothetical protein